MNGSKSERVKEWSPVIEVKYGFDGRDDVQDFVSRMKAKYPGRDIKQMFIGSQSAVSFIAKSGGISLGVVTGLITSKEGFLKRKRRVLDVYCFFVDPAYQNTDVAYGLLQSMKETQPLFKEITAVVQPFGYDGDSDPKRYRVRADATRRYYKRLGLVEDTDNPGVLVWRRSKTSVDK